MGTPGPGDVSQPMQQDVPTSQPGLNSSPSSMAYSSYMPPTSSYQPMPMPSQRFHHVNYIPQSGNAPLINDYANMPCNLQEARMAFNNHQQTHAHGFPMIPSLEETLRDLPYDAIHPQKALSNQSGRGQVFVNFFTAIILFVIYC